MTCPVCGERSGVAQTYFNNDTIKRHRKCKLCGYRFATIELDYDYYERLETAVDYLSKKKGIKR